MTIACTVTAAQLRELRALLRRGTTPVGHARRARVIVLTAEGRSGAEIASMVGIAPEVVSRIRRRFVEHGVEGLADQPKGRPKRSCCEAGGRRVHRTNGAVAAAGGAHAVDDAADRR